MQELGGYRLETKLGAGGMGAVWRATHPRFPGREFAVKVLLGDEEPDATTYARFRREIEALVAVTNHPGIVKIFGFAQQGDRPFIVMELVRGRSLQGLAKDQALAPRDGVKIVREIADAVAHAHAQGVVHRDLKPDNVLIEGATGKPRICDFGLARVADSERLTRSGSFLGTPAYAAPEQIDGRAHLAKERADVYSLGGILFFVLTGRPPFVSSGNALTKSVLFDPPPHASSVSDKVPMDLDAVCLKCLEKEPERRYANAAEFRDELDRFLAGEPVLASVPTQIELLRRTLGKKKKVLALMAAGVLLVAAVAVAAFVKTRIDAERDAVEAKKFAARAEREALERLATFARLLRAEGMRNLSEEQLRTALDDSITAQCLNLVGEGKGEVILGDTLLERVDDLLESPPVIVRKGETAVERSDVVREFVRNKRSTVVERARPIAPVAARALDAYLELAARGAPCRALDGKRLDGAPEALAAVRADLEAATALPGVAGARAAWLLVDLHCLAGDREAATAALATAKKLAPQDPAAPILERALAEEGSDLEVFSRIVPGIAAVPSQALVLSRAMALRGRPALIERPELAFAPTGAAIERILARDDYRCFDYHQRHGVLPGDIHGELDSRRTALCPPGKTDILRSDDEKLRLDMEKLADEHLPRYEHLLHQGFSGWPDDVFLYKAASEAARKTTTTGAFRALWARSTSRGSYMFAFVFSQNRRLSRVDSGSADYFFEKPWDPPPALEGRAACEQFDQLLLEDARRDLGLLALAAAEPELARLVPLALRSAMAARRLEEMARLADQGTSLPEADRARLAFEALVLIQDLVALAPATGIIFRARALRFAIPGVLGEACATLDLERARVFAERIDPTDDNGTNYTSLALATAGESTAPLPGTATFDKIYRLFCDRVRLEAFRAAIEWSPSGHERRTKEDVMRDRTDSWVQRPMTHKFLNGITRLSTMQLEKDLLPKPADLDALRRFKTLKEYEEFLKKTREKTK